MVLSARVKAFVSICESCRYYNNMHGSICMVEFLRKFTILVCVSGDDGS